MSGRRMHRPRPTTTGTPGTAVAVIESGHEIALRDELRAERDTNQLLSESLWELERALLDPGWVRLIALSEQEFSLEGMRQLRAICRLYAIKNPLIKRGLNVRSAYVWGQGVEISARANGKEDGEQDVQAVVNDFLTAPGNVSTVTGPEARDQLEHALGTDGNVYIAAFTRPLTGQVSTRVIQADQIADRIDNPEDESEVWYYLRRWVQTRTDPTTGAKTTQTLERYYPALGYRPASRPSRIGMTDVAWDAPVIHVSVNRPLGWQYGVPDAYAAIDWANAYKDFLTDWAKLMRSLSRYAWKATTPASKAAQVRTAVARQPHRSITGEPEAAGGTAILSPDTALEAISKSGATIDADSGRPLAAMVAAALDVPVTMLVADPGVTGARATAETLDKPTEDAMSQRRNLWGSFLQRLLAYVIAESVRAPQGSLKGTIRQDRLSGREYVTLDGDTSMAIDVTWPPLKDINLDAFADAVQKASSTGVMPPEVLLRLLLTAFGVRGVDEIIEQLTDEDGQFIWPNGPPLAPGAALAALGRGGGDPATAGTGPMAGDGTDTNPPGDETDDGPQPGDKAPATDGS